MISANGGLPAHRYTPQVTQRWPRGSEPASIVLGSLTCKSAWSGDVTTPPLLQGMVLGTSCHTLVLSSSPQGLL